VFVDAPRRLGPVVAELSLAYADVDHRVDAGALVGGDARRADARIVPYHP
jgi:hypothetical protein